MEAVTALDTVALRGHSGFQPQLKPVGQPQFWQQWHIARLIRAESGPDYAEV